MFKLHRIMFILAFGHVRLLPCIGRPIDLLKKESKAYSWPKKEIIFKEAKLSKLICLKFGENAKEKDSMRCLNVGARTAWKFSVADEPEHCYKALNSVWIKVYSNSQNFRARGYGARDDYYSPRQSRSVSRSISPRDDRSHRSRARSPRHSRSFSRSVSPQDEKNHKPSRHTPSPIENGRAAYEPSRSQSPGRNSRNPARSRSRSYSPR
ncbi:hypothetical protein CDL12_12993 [Handroanthus impetiginosus]|uniref:Uncharacterized protein n=1 Tax=Handroanthus impetiginosus TaxID=429701 RepID=A0A2G9HA33_9LAMI|nr:hypothetical protein CDL12_12993 [Handroanthus impetiginosus]